MATETRLQTLRRLRSERLHERVDPLVVFAQRMGWACAGCGCDVDGYSLDCDSCFSRARKRAILGGHRPELREQARAYLVERRSYGRERGRQGHVGRRVARPEAMPVGARGHRGYAGGGGAL